MKTSRFALDVATGFLAGWVAVRAKAKAESTLQGWGEKLLPPAPGQKELPGADPAGHGDDDARHPGWDVALAWLKAADSELVQAFVGVARGRRGASSR